MHRSTNSHSLVIPEQQQRILLCQFVIEVNIFYYFELYIVCIIRGAIYLKVIMQVIIS